MEVKTLLTADDLLTIGKDKSIELVRGELVEMTPSGMAHGGIVSTLNIIVGGYVRANKLGRTYGAETGVVLERNPDTVRAPDFMFIATPRLSLQGDALGFSDLAPDLAVEVVSPGDRWDEVEEKVTEYLNAGVRMIWVVTPKTRSVHVYRPRKEVLRLSGQDRLLGEDVLPGFEISVTELFE